MAARDPRIRSISSSIAAIERPRGADADTSVLRAEFATAKAAAELREIARRVVAETTAAQGLPYHVEDAAVLCRVAALMLARPQGGDGDGAAA
jgi:hypothetical protein